MKTQSNPAGGGSAFNIRSVTIILVLVWCIANSLGAPRHTDGNSSISEPRRIMPAAVTLGAFDFPPPTPGSWSQKADMPLAFDAHAACAVDGILYVMGGHEIPLVYTELRTLFAYDPKTDSWTRKRDMPTPRRWPAACAVDGIIYVIGGGGMFGPALDAVEAYDPGTDTWVTKAHLPTPRSGIRAAVVDGIVYAMGGATGSAITSLQFLRTVEAYDPKTDRWTPKASLPATAAYGATCTVNGRIYGFCWKDTAEYDPKTDHWTRKASIPSWSLNCLGASFSAVDGLVYLFAAGNTAKSPGFSLAYDPGEDSYQSKRYMPMPCTDGACAAIDGKIYLAGGANQDPYKYPVGAAYYDSLWVFDPQGGMTPQVSGFTFESINRIRVEWKGEAGRLYGVQSTSNLLKGPWTDFTFSSGTNRILATNEMIEATGTLPVEDSQRFFRVFEAD